MTAVPDSVGAFGSLTSLALPAGVSQMPASGCAGLPLSATLRGNGRSVPVAVSDKGGGEYEGRFTVPRDKGVAPAAGSAAPLFRLSVELHGFKVGGSPFEVEVRQDPIFRFASAFDTNGVLYAIGTGFNRLVY